ncbi:MAG: dephospho-CoA kinase [Actinobacteria bacterium]|nr:dephospho-CoA kinase [Actinomycetota bacterium]
MISIALTGGIGAGKSLVAELFADLGAICIDSDQLAREVIERGKPGFDEVIARFGDEILLDGEIDRSKLAAIVFQNADARRDLENIIHPKVRELATKLTSLAGENAVVINEIPLLFETKGQDRFDLVITVEANIEDRRARLLTRGLKGYEIEKRIAAQATREERESISDFVIENDGDVPALERQVLSIWENELRHRIEK